MSITQQGRMMSISTPLGEDYLLINKLSATEGLSELFKFEVELLHEEVEEGNEPTFVDVRNLLGQLVSITITQEEDAARVFNGMINQFSQGNRDARFTYYYATIVPHVWILTQKFQSRVFQHLSVTDILKKIFNGFDVTYEIQGTLEPRNYCVQYRETDFAFASRLMEEEGLYYYFKYSDKKHQMVIANTPQSHEDCPSKSNIPFILDVTRKDNFIGSIGTWRANYKWQSGKVSLWDSHFEQPGKTLEAEKIANPSVFADKSLEIYDYPGGYAKKFDAINKSGGENSGEIQKIFSENKKIAEIRMQEIDAQYKTFSGISDCCSITAGYRFKLMNHPNKDFNVQYTLTSVTHEVEQSPDYISDDVVSGAYGNSFTCLPNTVPFRSPLITPKPVLLGSQTAFVVGPAGEEIFTDKYGRVKVQFHWDREGQSDSDSSCWIRVAQAWAGNRWGMMFIPRIGMEVVVEFLEGDPDQPIITGCVYNAATMPPYALPDEKTKMAIKSDSSIGGQGFNELRFEDKKGSEQIFIHGEKDIDIRIKNDRREYVGRDRHLVVKRDKRVLVKRDVERLIERDVKEEIKRDHNVKISGKVSKKIEKTVTNELGDNLMEKIANNYVMEIGGSFSVKAKTIVLEANSGLTISVGGNFVTINPAGVQINGTMVLINSGGAALPSLPAVTVPPMAPQEAEVADNADPGSKAINYKHQRAVQTPIQALKINAPTHNPKAPLNRSSSSSAQSQDKKHWIGLKLEDETGNPVPGEEYIITLPDGTTIYSGTTDEKGEARVKNIDPGNCQITFPNLDQDVWKKK